MTTEEALRDRMNFLESQLDALNKTYQETLSRCEELTILAERKGQESYEARRSRSGLVTALYRLIDINPHETGRDMNNIMPDEIVMMLRGWKAMGGK